MKARFTLWLALLCTALLAADGPGPQKYSIDFQKSEVGKAPDDFMILDGTFAVREVDGNKCLELAPDPIGNFGALFGPDALVATDVIARIWSASTGKRFPEIGIGTNDAGGYKLFVLPARHVLELRKGDDAIASAPFDWTSGSWTRLRLRVEPKDKTWLIQGKAWPADQKEPEAWTVHFQDTDAPPAGKASIWGNDY
ncbi:MAG TPA: hypothetical protein VLJ39_14875, partial [Tepidisphaeraceae bacterium]|nr:hypothetical protein [Tepidisphaeraceae bacterium]